MKRRGIAALALWAAALSVVSTSCGQPQGAEAEAPRRDIVLVVVDTLRRDALSVFDPRGQALTNIDAMAAVSLRFQDARSAASWTLPSLASLMTGSYPDRSGAAAIGQGLSAEAETLAELLRAGGYETLGFTDGGLAGTTFFSRGFDYMDGHVFSGALPRGTKALPRNGMPAAPGYATFDRVTQYLREAGEGGKPRFVFVHSYAVHDYWKVQPWHTANVEPFPDPLHYEDCVLGRQVCSEAQWERMKVLYAAGVSRMDQALGRLALALDSTARGRQSILVFLSDHGEGFNPEAGRIHHGGRLHEDQLRVPLMIRVPEMRAADISAPVSLVDVTPTLLELVELPLPGGLDGHSLIGLMRQEVAAGASSRALYAMEHFFWWDGGRRSAHLQVQSEPVSVAVMDAVDWLIEDGDEVRLYDMKSDPRQKSDVSQSRSARVAELRSGSAARQSLRRSGEPRPLSEETLENLRGLGYVE